MLLGLHYSVIKKMKVNKSFLVLLQGYALFYESMLPSVLHIRDRWMKKVRLKDRTKSDTVESLEFMVAQFSWYSLVAMNPCPRRKKNWKS